MEILSTQDFYDSMEELDDVEEVDVEDVYEEGGGDDPHAVNCVSKEGK